jgi:hypothetical protein
MNDMLIAPLIVIKTFLVPLIRDTAYLDPGSGSYIIQIILAALLGGLFVFRTYLKRVVDKVRTLFSRQKDANDNGEK